MAGKIVSLDLLRDVLTPFYPNVVFEEYHEETAANRGDNYVSMLFRVLLKGHTQDLSDNQGKSDEFVVSLVYKILPESVIRREAFRSDILFKNEAAFYGTVVPGFLKFQSRMKVVKPFSAWPRCFLARNDLIILEDLRPKGYFMADRKAGLTNEQCYAVLKELAHFHAVSLAMKVNAPDEFNTLKGCIEEVCMVQENKKYYRNYYAETSQNAINLVQSELTEIYMEKFSKFLEYDDYYLHMTKLVTPEEPLAAITHGDCWTNNILFKCNDKGQIQQACFVDFQIARYASPTLDLVYVLYLCTTREQRKDLLFMLDFYCCILHSKLLEMHCTEYELDELRSSIQSEFNRSSQFALGLALDMFPIMTCDEDQAPDLYESETQDRLTDDVSGAEQCQSTPVYTTNESCRRKMADLIMELVDSDLL